jgi:hypothetical protein
MPTVFIALFLVFVACVSGDQGFYINSNAAFSAGSETNLVSAPIVRNEILTSNIYDAETADNILITYVGEFSNSGPHSLGSFQRGSTKLLDIQLARKIGKLRGIVLENSGTDSWLMSTIFCHIGQIRYELSGPRVWLEAMDPLSEQLHEDPFSPDAQTRLPSSSHQELAVKDQYYVYDITGIVQDV